MSKQKPIVALVGRPNVGKSTLFNRIVGQRKAIVEDLAGTTRDRLYGTADWGGRDFVLIDTGGLEFDNSAKEKKYRGRSKSKQSNKVGFQAGSESRLFLTEIRDQIMIAINEADVIIFLVDGETGLTNTDEDVAEHLRRTQKPVILAVNKADNKKRRENAVEFYAIGLNNPIPISAMHGTGTGDLLDLVVESFPMSEEEEEEEEDIKIAILGRPNVGKSSLLNKLLGEDRVIVSNVAGTTRDAIDTHIEYKGFDLTLIDTAGIRRRGKIEPGVEKHSFLRTVKAVNRTDLCLLLIDAGEMVAAQDAHIAGYILEENKSVVVIVNKWDTIDDKDTYTINEFTKLIRAELQFLDYVPILFISALTGQRVDKVLDLALRVQEERLRRISTGQLNRLLREAVAKHPPKGGQRYRLKFFYVTQAGINPPTFVFFVNDRSLVHFTYERYLENQIRAKYDFLGTPIRLIFRNRNEKDL
ncbi:ribosome biogenesis GTPase Der [Anaerolineales bacterium HSG6]|nr:ribosome biogenesis GTPase Der [Anaerolineales bacterium HSG6]MDM8531823.1 ribosome biogenesis GTPase Der [Anaerolineales bacterium HSG25]